MTEQNKTTAQIASIEPLLPAGSNAGTVEKFEVEEPTVKHGLGVITAGLFLAGEMAGSGVLALPAAMVGTGWGGTALILMFTVNAAFIGSRLGLCWVILEERYVEFRREIRDPYPTIGEKAVGRWGRVLSTVCICLTLYGAGCVFIVLIAQLLGSFVTYLGFTLTLCQWMAIVATALIPLTWLGTPKDFWPIAIGALITTVLACLLIVVQSFIDHSNMEEGEEVYYPAPSVEGSFKAFASIMFAFAGASTFPTIQADMKTKSNFPKSVKIACVILFLIYLPIAAAGYFAFGGHANSNIVLSISDGPIRVTVEVMLLLHLISAFPIILNPPNQYFEHVLKIPSVFNWKRCAFRSFSVVILLFIAETIPSFGNILDLVGASTVTLLTFVMPPYFYMRLCDSSSQNSEWTQRKLPIWERTYCWIVITIGLFGGASATYTALKNIVSTEFAVPCYLQGDNITVSVSH